MFAEGIASHRAGRLGEAERLYRKILELDPAHAASLHLLGMVAFQTGHGEAALELIRKAIVSNGADAAYYTDLGIVLQMQGKFEEAAGCYERAIELSPRSVGAFNNRGLALQMLGRLEEGAESFARALEVEADCAEAHTGLGNLRQAQGRLEEAEACHLRALAVRPGYAEAWSNLGCVRHLKGELDEAVACFRQALELQPGFAEGHNNLGDVLQAMGKLAEAARCYERAVELKPGYARARLNGSTIRLLMGDFAAGLREYEWRWEVLAQRGFAQPRWNGERLHGARILLHAEQGLGDTLQFLRYVPMVQAAGGRVVLEVQPSLRRLAGLVPGVREEDVVAAGALLPPFAWQCPLMSLPLVFGSTLESIPAETPYLFVPRKAAEKAARVAWPASGLRVGLVWVGSAAHLKDRFRSIPSGLLEPLLEVSGARFFSLQVSAASGQQASLDERITDLAPEIGDMADTAALIARLDLVIAVDTSVAHLAGALGKPVWVMLPFAPDWRWLVDREDSPWYPAMRLFRQQTVGDWESVIEAVRDALVEEIESLAGEDDL